MEFKVSGKLKTASAEQPSFKGFRIEASFDRKPAPPPSRPSTYWPVTGEVIVLDDATATPIETSSESAPDQIAAASATSTSEEAPIASRVSALSDDAGNFTLVFPDPCEIVSKTVKFAVSSPARRIVREIEVMTADLGTAITIEVEAFDDKRAPIVNTPQTVAVDMLFQTDAVLRQTITKNLRALRGESEAVTARVEKAWKFNPSQLSADELERRHYVARGADPYKMLETVITRGAAALSSANVRRTLTLRKSAELDKLIKNKQEPTDSLYGVVEFGPLMEFIQRRGTGPFEVAEPTLTRYRADAEADAILDAVGNSGRAGVAKDVAALEGSSSGTGGADELVKNTVNMQMKSATAPESQLVYGKIPNSADEDKVQSNILESFQPKPLGPTDVTSYHDFHTLQIAFEHVWTQIFDGQLESLGRELYQKYVELKSFVGVTDADVPVSTLEDLRRLMATVRALSQAAQDNIPPEIRGNDGTSNEPKDATDLGDLFGKVVTKGTLGAVLGPIGLFLEEIINAIDKAGEKPRIRWAHVFGSRQLNRPQDKIIARAEPNVAAPRTVEIALVRTPGQRWRSIEFQQFDPNIGPNPFFRAVTSNSNDPQWQYPGGAANDGTPIVLATSQLEGGLLQFSSQEGKPSEEKSGRYILGDLSEVLKDGTRVTFDWVEG